MLRQLNARATTKLESADAVEACATHLAKMFAEVDLAKAAYTAVLQTVERDARINPHDPRLTARVRRVNQATAVLKRFFAEVEGFTDNAATVVDQLRRETAADVNPAPALA